MTNTLPLGHQVALYLHLLDLPVPFHIKYIQAANHGKSHNQPREGAKDRRRDSDQSDQIGAVDDIGREKISWGT